MYKSGALAAAVWKYLSGPVQRMWLQQ